MNNALADLHQGETNLVNSIAFLEELSLTRARVDMRNWGWRLKNSDEPCKTTACALGHIAMAGIIPGLGYVWETCDYEQHLNFVYKDYVRRSPPVIQELFGFTDRAMWVMRQNQDDTSMELYMERPLVQAFGLLSYAFYTDQLSDCIRCLNNARVLLRRGIEELEVLEVPEFRNVA